MKYLADAIAIEDEALRLFRDDSGRFYVTASTAEPLLVRPRETGDGAIPSGNSVQLMNLVRIAHITADRKYSTAASELVRASSDGVSLAPSVSTHFLSGLDFLLGPSFEIVLSGSDVTKLQRAVFAGFVPNKVVIHRPAGEAPAITAIAPFTKEQRAGRKATAYICTNYQCKLPTTEPGRIRDLLRR